MQHSAPLLALLAAVLATCQLVEVVHHGSLFAPLRRLAAAWRDSSRRAVRLAGELLHCPFCFSMHAGLWMTLLAVGAGYWPWLAWPVWWLAVVRAANLLNDVSHAWSRSP